MISFKLKKNMEKTTFKKIIHQVFFIIQLNLFEYEYQKDIAKPYIKYSLSKWNLFLFKRYQKWQIL